MKDKILQIIKDAQGYRFTSKELAGMLNITHTESSRFLLILCNSFEIKFERKGNYKVFYVPSESENNAVTQRKIPKEFKPMVGYAASLSLRLDDGRKDFHLITLDERA